MMSYVITALAAAAVFGLCLAGMAIGLILRGRVMRGGCGSSTEGKGGCDTCRKPQVNLCKCSPGDEALTDASLLATLGRYDPPAKREDGH